MAAFGMAIRELARAGLATLSTVAARAEDIVVTHYGSLLYGTSYAVALEKGYFQAGRRRRHRHPDFERRRHLRARCAPSTAPNRRTGRVVEYVEMLAIPDRLKVRLRVRDDEVVPQPMFTKSRPTRK
jgi:hypothetical protein